MPLLIDPATNEPYIELDLSLHEPFPADSKIRITPPRLTPSDIAQTLEIHAHPSVNPYVRTPWPFLEEHAIARVTMWKKQSAEVLEREIKPKLSSSSSTSEVTVAKGKRDSIQVLGQDLILSGCPVNTIRLVREDGTDVKIGEISFRRCLYGWVENEEERKRVIVENDAKLAGDPTIWWHIGYVLHPGYHSQGIMTAALRTLLKELWIPHLNAHFISTGAFIDNIGSQKVFMKCGFEQKGWFMCDTDLSYKGRTELRIVIFQWRRQTDDGTMVGIAGESAQ